MFRIVDPDTNETVTTTRLVEIKSGDPYATIIMEDESVSLRYAEYRYPGRTASRPQSVTFIFLPKDAYKKSFKFSLIADETEVHQGDVVFTQFEYEVNNRKVTQQEVRAIVPLDIFFRLMQAKKVQIKLEKKTFKLNGYQRKCIAALADTIAAIGD